MNKSDNLTDGVQQIQHDSLNAVFELDSDAAPCF